MVDKLKVVFMDKSKIDASVDLFMQTFSKEPWNDIYESRNQVVNFFEKHMDNNYFVGYVGMLNDNIVALSLGFKKPWINGSEYYIDEFCVSRDIQGQGIGSEFLKYIEADIRKHEMNAMILNTERNFPAKVFYEKNGFKTLDELIILAKRAHPCKEPKQRKRTKS